MVTKKQPGCAGKEPDAITTVGNDRHELGSSGGQMKYNKVSVVKKIMLLLMTMALAVAMVACSAAAPGKAGEDGKDAVPVPQRPDITQLISDVTVVQGMTDEVDLSEAFSDPEGKTLTFTATPKDKAIATATVKGTTLTVTGVKVGSTTVAVTATDPGKLSVRQSLTVTVTEAPPEPEPPVTIDDVKMNYPTLEITPTATDKTAEIELPAGYTLISLNEDKVTVDEKAATTSAATSVKWAAATANAANVWVLTAVAEGLAVVDVLDESESVAHTIRVTVTADPPPDPVAPEITEMLEDVWLGEDRDSHYFDLEYHFSHTSTMTYSVTVEDKTVATYVLDGSMLTITKADSGDTRMAVTAEADGESETDHLNVYVRDHNVATPYTMGTINDIELTVGNSLGVNVANRFADPQRRDMTLNVDSNDEEIATVEADGSTVTVTAIGAGTATITVSAIDDEDLESGDLSFEVMVSEPTTDPDPEPENMPPIKTGIGDKPLRPGASEMISLNDYFSDPEGGALSYNVRSSDSDKVTATESGGTLTLEAKMVGTATITVDATDDADNMVSDMFTVTVDMDCPSMMDLDVGEIQTCDLPEGYSIHDPKSGATVRVARVPGATANTYSFQGLNPGSVDLAVQDKSFTTVNTITVTVIDPKPTRNTKANPGSSDRPLNVGVFEDGRKVYSLATALTQATVLNSYFEDNDLSTLKFKAKLPPGMLIQLKDGAVMDTDEADGSWNFTIEVLNFPGTNTFDIEFYAIDAADQESENPVVFTFITGLVMQPPATLARSLGSYDVGQYTSGDFKKTEITIGNRLGVTHRIPFGSVISGTNEGFRFAQNRLLELEAADRLPEKIDADRYHLNEVDAGEGDTVYKKPANTPHASDANSNAVVGVDYWEVTTSGAISVDDTPFTDMSGNAADAGPETGTLYLEVTPNRTGAGTITIKYYVWTTSGSVTGIANGTLGGKWESVMRTLTVNIKTCFDFDECNDL